MVHPFPPSLIKSRFLLNDVTRFEEYSEELPEKLLEGWTYTVVAVDWGYRTFEVLILGERRISGTLNYVRFKGLRGWSMISDEDFFMYAFADDITIYNPQKP